MTDKEIIKGLLDMVSAPLDAVYEPLLIEPQEQELYKEILYLESVCSLIMAHKSIEDYKAVLMLCSQLNKPVNDFLDNIRLNVEDKGLARNRQNLLKRAHALMNQVADLSKL